MKAAQLAILLALPGCWPSLEEEAARDLGPEVGDEGPTHRPGQPCLACHGERYAPGEEIFVLAGTVYERPTDTLGLRGAEVIMTDADDRRFTVLTNQTGNFMVSVDDEQEEAEEGWLVIPFEPTFPVRVSVRRGATETLMRNVIGREGSCAACHTDPPGATSNGKVFVVE